jgi:hypothetical protein
VCGDILIAAKTVMPKRIDLPLENQKGWRVPLADRKYLLAGLE